MGASELKNFFSDTSFLVQNVRSFNSSDLSFATTKHKLKVLLSSRADFLLLSEIKLCNNNITRKMSNFLKLKNYDLFVNSDSKARGVAIIIKSDLYDTVETVFKCQRSNSLILNFSKGEVRWTFWAAYFDSTDDTSYLKEMAKKAKTGFPLFMGGDFNCVMDNEQDPKLNTDLFNRSGIPNKKISKEISFLMNDFGLLDAFRCKNGDKQDFSFFSAGGASRIDHLLIPKELKNIVTKSNYLKLSNYFDHKGLLLNMKAVKRLKKKRILNELFSSMSGKRIIKMGKFYTFYDQLNIQLPVDLQSNCEELLSSNNKIIGIETFMLHKEDKWLEYLLELEYRNFNLLWGEVNLIFGMDLALSPSMAIVVLINHIKNDLLSLSGSIISSRKARKDNIVNNLKRAKRVNDTELSFKLQNELDSLNAIEIDLLQREVDPQDPMWETSCTKGLSNYLNYNTTASLQELEVEGQQGYGVKCFNHFKEAFGASTRCDSEDLRSFLKDIPAERIPGLLQGEKDKLTVGFSNLEILTQLESMKVGKSVGLDGISAEFLKSVVPENIDLFRNGFNDCYLNGAKLDASLKTAYIKLIPKSKADHSKLKGWRPITIISNLNKLYCKLIYARLEKITDRLIEPGQYAYRKSKDISDVRLNLLEIIESFKCADEKALLLSLDFSAAFDSITHPFIKETLLLFGFPPQFIGAIMGYLEDNVAGILLEDGSLTNFFNILRGTGQGNPLSCLIFILAINLLMIKLNFSPSLSKINHAVQGIVPLTSRAIGYADDLCSLLNMKASDILELDKILTQFGEISGLILNKKKTVLCCLNENWDNLPELKSVAIETGFSIGTSTLPLLGLSLKLDGSQVDMDIWDPVLKKINATIFRSRALNLPTGGKLAVIKTFCLSSIAYTARMVSLPENYCARISSYFVNFINSGGERFSEESIFREKKFNGLGIPKVKDFCRALLCKNMSRFLHNNETWGHVLKAKFVDGQPDKSITRSPTSPSLRVTAEAMSNAGILFYNSRPSQAPLFFSPFLKLKCKDNGLGSSPPKCPDLLRATVSKLTVKNLINPNFSLEYLSELLGYNPGGNFYLQVRGGDEEDQRECG